MTFYLSPVTKKEKLWLRQDTPSLDVTSNAQEHSRAKKKKPVIAKATPFKKTSKAKLSNLAQEKGRTSNPAPLKPCCENHEQELSPRKSIESKQLWSSWHRLWITDYRTNIWPKKDSTWAASNMVLICWIPSQEPLKYQKYLKGSQKLWKDVYLMNHTQLTRDYSQIVTVGKELPM